MKISFNLSLSLYVPIYLYSLDDDVDADVRTAIDLSSREISTKEDKELSKAIFDR
jgi:hypothetical protein